MADLDLEAIRERYARTRRNDWQNEPVANRVLYWGASANDVPALLAEVARLRAETERLTTELSGAELAVHTARTTEVLAQRENAIARRGWREAEAERDAMRPVVEAAREWHQGRGRESAATLHNAVLTYQQAVSHRG